MDELLAMIAGAILEILGEVLLEAFSGIFADFFLRALRKFYRTTRLIPSVLLVVYCFLFGAIFGLVSVLILPHQIAPHTRFHGVNLLISPVIVGLIMSLVGLSNRRRNRRTVQIESFGYGFVFAFGIAIVRLFLAQ